MYTPASFRFNNLAQQVAFMKRYSFATMVTAVDNVPVATQLPFFVNDSAEKLVLSAHFAKANEQSKHIVASTSLIIFTEPHAYISPSHYDKRESVPTWDYIAVHVYGKAAIITDETQQLLLLEQMINFYEKEYLAQWHSLPDKFKKGMIQGIVAFEFEVTDIQAQQKLSQNKTQEERNRIITQLEKSNLSTEKDIATYIRELK